MTTEGERKSRLTPVGRPSVARNDHARADGAMLAQARAAKSSALSTR